VRSALIIFASVAIAALAVSVSFSQGGSGDSPAQQDQHRQAQNERRIPPVIEYEEAKTRSKVSRVKADMRTLATAIESFYIDHNRYSAGRKLIHAGYDVKSLESVGIAHLSTVDPGRPDANGQMSQNKYDWGLSTPISYIRQALIHDPFSPLKPKNPYIYHTGQPQKRTQWHWIIISAGPDGDYDFDPIKIYKQFPSPEAMAALIYDPSNGSVSGGDLLRTEKGIVEPGFFEM